MGVNDPRCVPQRGSLIRVVSLKVEELSMFYKVFPMFFPCETFVRVEGHKAGHLSGLWDTTRVIDLRCGTQHRSFVHVVGHNADKLF